MARRGVLFWDFDGTLGFGPHGPGAWAPCLVEALDELHAGHSVSADDLRPFTRNRYPWHCPDVVHTHLRTAEDWWAALELVFVEAFRGVGYGSSAAALATRAAQLYADGSRWGLFADTVSVLDDLAAQGWRHIVLSNNIPSFGQTWRCSALVGCSRRSCARPTSATRSHTRTRTDTPSRSPVIRLFDG